MTAASSSASAGDAASGIGQVIIGLDTPQEFSYGLSRYLRPRERAEQNP
jgi:hypothetical protein